VCARGPREADATVPSGLRYRLIGGPSLGKTAKNEGRASARVVLGGWAAVIGLGATPGRPPGWVAAMEMLIHSPSRASWARLLRRIFEVDPLLCAACGSEMKIVSVITEPNVIDAILRHLAKTGGRDPFEGRAPPAA